MRKLITAVLAAALTLGLGVVLPADQASAHDYDGYSRIYCEAHKSHSWQTIVHSWPYLLEPGHLTYVCTQDYFGVRHQFFVDRNMDTGEHELDSGYQPCATVYCTPHG